MTPLIRLQQLTKTYGQQTALQSISLEVPAGVVFALLGENGAGKSTTIKLMLGLQQPTAGQVEVLGLNAATQGEEIRRRIGYVAERPTLYDWMTVEEIGWFTSGFYAAGFEAGYQRLIAQYHLPAKKKISELSKGMRAKVSLALAMAHDPDLLILDEPTSGLDTLVRREFMESMVDRAASGKTVFLSSHQIGEVERVADWVALLREGELIVVERLEQLKAEMHEVTLTFTQRPAGTTCGARRNVSPTSSRTAVADISTGCRCTMAGRVTQPCRCGGVGMSHSELGRNIRRLYAATSRTHGDQSELSVVNKF
jgi:ABC-2 type transport system ATP-binding protein